MQKLSAIAVLFSFVACGTSICKANQNRATDFKKKHAACADIAASITVPTDASVKACDTASSACTADDKKKVEDAGTCIDGLAACTEATKEAFTAAATACFAKREGVSATCTAALSGS